MLKSSISLEPVLVRKALVLVQTRYPLLRMRVDTLDAFMMFKEMQERLAVVFKTLDDYDAREWVRVLEDESRLSFDLIKGPLWRVTMLQEHFDGEQYQNSLLFTFHHVICDGTSIMTLYNTFLKYLNDLQQGKEVIVESMALDSSMMHKMAPKLQPNLFEKLFFPVFPTLMKIKSFLVKPAKNVYLAAFPPPILEDPSIVKRASVLPVVIKKEEISQLMMMGKKHGCTFHSIITAATCLAMAQILQTDSKNRLSGLVKFSNSFNVSLRNDLQPPIAMDEFGLYISVLMMSIATSSAMPTHQTFWDYAKQCHTTIKGKIQRKEHYQICKVFANVDAEEITSLIQSIYGDPSNCYRLDDAFHISNRGRFTIGREMDIFKFAGTYYAVAEQHMGHLFFHNVVSVNGDLYWGLVYFPHITAKEQAQQFIELSLDILKVAASSSTE